MLCAAADIKFLLPALDLTDTLTVTTVNGIINQQDNRITGKYPAIDPIKNPILSVLCCYRSAAIVAAALLSGGNAIGQTNLSAYYDRLADNIEASLDSGIIAEHDEEGHLVPPVGLKIIEY